MKGERRKRTKPGRLFEKLGNALKDLPNRFRISISILMCAFQSIIVSIVCSPALISAIKVIEVEFYGLKLWGDFIKLQSIFLLKKSLQSGLEHFYSIC